MAVFLGAVLPGISPAAGKARNPPQAVIGPGFDAIPIPEQLPVRRTLTLNLTEREGRSSVGYPTLAIAVAAQEADALLNDETRCLAIGVYYEAKGEPLVGQLAVAEVILNRTRSGRFPRNACEVLRQPGQFAFVRDGRLVTPQQCPQWSRAVQVAQVAQRNLWDSPVPDALFFHARYVNPGWQATEVATLGNHIFYR